MTVTLRLSRAARLLLLRFTNPGRYAVVRSLREISALTGLLAHSHNNHVLRQRDANVYTHMQKAIRGRSRIRSRGLLAGVENILFGCKTVLGSVNSLRGAPKEHRGTITSLMEKMSSLLTRLELQLMAGSAENSSALGKELLLESSAIRRTLKTARSSALSASDSGRQSANVNEFITVLTDFEEWLRTVETMSAQAVRRQAPPVRSRLRY